MFQNAYLLECLTAIYDQIPKSLSGADEFPDDHAHQTKADIYLHICKDQRDAGGQNDFQKFLLLAASESADQLSLFRVHFPEACVQV